MATNATANRVTQGIGVAHGHLATTIPVKMEDCALRWMREITHYSFATALKASLAKCVKKNFKYSRQQSMWQSQVNAQNLPV